MWTTVSNIRRGELLASLQNGNPAPLSTGKATYLPVDRNKTLVFAIINSISQNYVQVTPPLVLSFDHSPNFVIVDTHVRFTNKLSSLTS